MEKQVYVSDSDLNNYFRAKKYERAGEWSKARELWKAMGRTGDVAAIDMILESTAMGDEYRRLNESCPVCSVVSLKETTNCPNCNINKSWKTKNNNRE